MLGLVIGSLTCNSLCWLVLGSSGSSVALTASTSPASASALVHGELSTPVWLSTVACGALPGLHSGRCSSALQLDLQIDKLLLILLVFWLEILTDPRDVESCAEYLPLARSALLHQLVLARCGSIYLVLRCKLLVIIVEGL